MAEYHVGCGLSGIYAGRLDKDGYTWLSKSDVTDEVLHSAFDYLYTNQKEVRGTIRGVEFALRIVPVEEKKK